MTTATAAELLAARDPGDLVVGFPNPNEVREITTPLDVEGNVIVVGNGRLRISGTELRVRGSVVLLQNGRLEAQDGKLEFRQRYPYERALTVGNTAAAWFNGSILSCGGYNLNVAVSDTAALRYDGSTVTEGIATTVLDEFARIDATDSENLGEILYFGHAQGSFERCNALLSWLTLPGGSSVTATLPGNAVLDSYAFPDAAEAATGIDFRVSFSGCTGLWWGLMLEPGCAATIRDSELLAVGGLFRGNGEGAISGLTNGVTMESARYPVQDRDVRFERSTVHVWNLYAFDSFRLTVANSIFGEIITFGRSEALVQNSICDGSGGYVGAFEDSRMTLTQSRIPARVIGRGRAQIYAVGATLDGEMLHAADNSLLALLHSTFPALPTVDVGAAAAVLAVDDPRQASVDALVPVHGTVRFLPGAEFPVTFVSYWLSAANSSNPDLELWKSAPSIVQRYRETIGTWDTHGLSPGDYLLAINMRLSTGDTVAVPAPVRLTAATVAVSDAATAPVSLIASVHPQPARAGVPVTLQLDGSGHTQLVLHDARGREVRRDQAIGGAVSIPTTALAPGLYILTATRNGIIQRRPIQIIR